MFVGNIQSCSNLLNVLQDLSIVFKVVKELIITFRWEIIPEAQTWGVEEIIFVGLTDIGPTTFCQVCHNGDFQQYAFPKKA